MAGTSRVGEIIGERYRVVATLGEGGIALALRVEELATGRPLVAKELSLRGMGDWKVLELFQREARVLAAIEHPRVPRYVDHFDVEVDGERRFYLIQELAPGRPLSEWLASGWRPDEAEVRSIADQVLVILGALHAREPPVVHRDIKPQNLVRDDDGTVRLIDFGAVTDALRHTTSGGSTVAGTFGYMAPEQLRGQATAATDLFGLGATLLTLVSSKTIADLPQKKLRIVLDGVVHSPSLRAWLEMMLEPDPADRFPSAAAARKALATGAGVRSRRRGPLVVAAAVAAASIGAATWSSIRSMTAEEPAHERSSVAGRGASSEESVAQIPWVFAVPAHFSAVFSVAASPDGTLLASASVDGTVKLWHGESGAAAGALPGHQGRVGAVRFSPDGKRLFTADAVGVRCFDLDSRAERWLARAHAPQAMDVAMSPDGAIVASGGADGAVRLWDAATGAPIRELRHHAGAGRVYSVSFSPDGKRIASGGSDKIVRVWDAKSGAPVTALSGHGAGVTRVAFAPDGETLLSVSDDGSLRAWLVGRREGVYTRALTRGELWGLAIAPDGSWLATSGQDGVVRIVTTMTGMVRRAFDELSGGRGTTGLAVDRDGTRVISGGSDGRVKVWDVARRVAPQPRGLAATIGDEDNSTRRGWTPLHIAAWDGNVAEVKRLLASGALVDAANEMGRTPLYLAAKRGHLSVVEALAGRQAVIDRRASYGFTALIAAAERGNTDVVRYLLAHGADPAALNDGNESGLYKASAFGYADVVALFLEKRVPLNQLNGRGFTSLASAASHGFADVVALLCAAPGVDLELKIGRERYTALELAAYEGHLDVVRILVKQGARTARALEIARTRGETEIARLLATGASR